MKHVKCFMTFRTQLNCDKNMSDICLGNQSPENTANVVGCQRS